MPKRFVTIWFRYLKTDRFTLRQPALAAVPFVLASPDHGRMVVTAANIIAQSQGVDIGMAVADARAIIPSLQVLDDKPELSTKLLRALAEWFIRYTPLVSVDPPTGLILDTTGCAHLWGGEKPYLAEIITRLKRSGYTVRTGMADTIGTAWAIAYYGADASIIEHGQQTTALLSLPPASLRLETETAERLEKLGLRKVSQFISMPQSALRRRFGQSLLKRLDQALGHEEEPMIPVLAPEPFQERLPCLDPIITANGIAIALERLLDALCHRLKQEGKGLRAALLKCYRVDGKIEQVSIGTNRASNNTRHIFKLFEFKLPGIEPALGIELFILEAPKVEDVSAAQETLWESTGGLNNVGLAELLDRVVGKMGTGHIHRYLPAEHYWPERSFQPATDLLEQPLSAWKAGRPRPLQLLPTPECIEVTAPIPDYPPMMFRHKGILHKITRADGPERIEPEWWIQEGQHRDYYCVEDEEGCRYWLFRSGHYDAEKSYQWFIHGFFA